MKTLFLGIALIVLVGIGGLVYRNSLTRPVVSTGACTLDAKVCPDGSAVGRVAPDCNFAACPAPNVTLDSAHIVFALPAGYSDAALPDSDAIAAYESADPSVSGTASTSQADELVIHDYAIPSGETGADVMHATAIGDASGLPASPSAFAAATLGNATYTMVVLGRFEGVVHVAYYLPRGADVLRFDAIDRGVTDWTNSSLNVAALPANAALRAMLATIQTN